MGCHLHALLLLLFHPLGAAPGIQPSLALLLMVGLQCQNIWWEILTEGKEKLGAR